MFYQYQAEIILHLIYFLNKVKGKKSMSYKYINRIKLMYHKLIHLYYLIAFILQLKQVYQYNTLYRVATLPGNLEKPGI